MDQQFLRQQLIKIIISLPQDMLLELVSFVNYLRYKSSAHSGVSHAETVSPQPQALEFVDMEPEIPMYQRSSSQELSQAFLDWVDSHRSMDLPTLSDAAISRDSIYEDQR